LTGEEVLEVTQNMIVAAKYDLNSYTVKFLNWDGSVLREQSVEYGAAAEAPEIGDPPQDGMLFKSWSGLGTHEFVAEDLTLTPIPMFTDTVAAPVADAEAAGLSITVIPEVTKAAAVTASPAPGALASGATVTLSTATAGATIRYTTDGGEPSAASTLYTAPIAITAAVTIKAKAFKDGLTESDTLTAAYTVTAAPPPATVAVTGVSLDRSTASLAVNASLTLVPTISPANAANKSVSWTSSNTAVATVAGNGLVTGVAAGTATITVTTADGGKTASCGVTVSAAGQPGAPAITVGSVTGRAGGTVTIPVTIANNPGIAGFTLELAFDKNVLVPVSISPGAGIGSVTSNIQSGVGLSTLDRVTANWADSNGMDDDGELFSVTFQIKQDASAGATSIVLTYRHDNDIASTSGEGYVNPDVTNGTLSVVEFLFGDLNSDNKVNSLDAVKLARYLAKWSATVMSPAELAAADVNADGKVNSLDAVRLARYLAKWAGVTLGE
jgi:hypothetical protein